MSRTVALRKSNKTQLGFTLPSDISKSLGNLLGHRFEVHLTDEGVLYKYVGPPTDTEPELEPIVVPAWADGNGDV